MTELLLLLKTALAGAESKNLSDDEIRICLRPLIDSEHREVNTREAALMLGKAPVTLKRWRANQIGPRFRKDDGGCVRYQIGWLREHQSKGIVL